ncbi:hypothetical protein Hanom_Chr09g00818621 [Helianthus anomalus]
MNYRTQAKTLPNVHERERPLFMFVHLTKRTKFLVRVRLFNKRTNTNELPAKRFTNCSPNVWFVYSPIYYNKGYHVFFSHNYNKKLLNSMRFLFALRFQIWWLKVYPVKWASSEDLLVLEKNSGNLMI